MTFFNLYERDIGELCGILIFFLGLQDHRDYYWPMNLVTTSKNINSVLFKCLEFLIRGSKSSNLCTDGRISMFLIVIKFAHKNVRDASI